MTSPIPDRFITGSLLAKALGQGAAPRVIAWGPDAGGRLRALPLAVKTLAADAQLRARASAFRFLTGPCGFADDHLYTKAGESLVDFEVKVQVLASALVEASPPHAPVAKDADELRAMLDPDEVAVLFEHFLDWQEERSPISRATRWEEVEDHLAALGKGSMPASWLAGCDAATLRVMVAELAARWTTATRPNSSPTSPSSAPTA